MATVKRIWFPGAIYHVTARGNHRECIFKGEEDFVYYLDLIKEALNYYINDKYEIMSYCLMSNHVHILIKTQENPLGQFIGRINSKYARYFNKKYNCSGHLFQDRYYSEMVETDSQLLEISRYIHLNPVRAKMVKMPEGYRWSSYSMYIGNQKEDVICSEKLLYYFRDKSRDLYKQYVEEAIRELPQGNFPWGSTPGVEKNEKSDI